MKKIEEKPQLFIIDDEIWQNSSLDEVCATAEDMQELGIFRPPCEHFEVLIRASFALHIVQPDDGESFGNETIEHHQKTIYRIEYKTDLSENWEQNLNAELGVKDKTTGEWVGLNWAISKALIKGRITKQEAELHEKQLANTVNFVLYLLIVALATRNVVRKNKPSRMAKQGISASRLKKDYDYTTTLTIGKVEGAEREGGGDTGGWKVRPHLRRGHIREQKYGPSNMMSKKVFIQPVFVNAADGVVSQRKAYNVRMPRVMGGEHAQIN
jgi:hypothetical protein